MRAHLLRREVKALLGKAEKHLYVPVAIAQCSGPLDDSDELFTRLWRALAARRPRLFPELREHPESLLYMRGPQLAWDYYTAQGRLKHLCFNSRSEERSWATLALLLDAAGVSMPDYSMPTEGWLLPTSCALHTYMADHGWLSIGLHPGQSVREHVILKAPWRPRPKHRYRDANDFYDLLSLWHRVSSELAIAAAAIYPETLAGDFFLLSPLKAAVTGAAAQLLARTALAPGRISDYGEFASGIYPAGGNDREVLALLSLFAGYQPRDIGSLWHFAVNALACENDPALVELIRDWTGAPHAESDPGWWQDYFTAPDTPLSVQWANGEISHTIGTRREEDDR
jgi:hypothetical protein